MGILDTPPVSIYFHLFSMLRILDSISFLDIPMLSNDTEIYSFENIMRDSRNPIETTETNTCHCQNDSNGTL